MTPPPSHMSLIDNERAKLSATFLNNIAVAVIGSGLIAPFFVVLYGLGNLNTDQIRFFGLAAPGWVLLGGGLHYIARGTLGRLKE